jgi:hypothetical protein
MPLRVAERQVTLEEKAVEKGERARGRGAVLARNFSMSAPSSRLTINGTLPYELLSFFTPRPRGGWSAGFWFAAVRPRCAIETADLCVSDAWCQGTSVWGWDGARDRDRPREPGSHQLCPHDLCAACATLNRTASSPGFSGRSSRRWTARKGASTWTAPGTSKWPSRREGSCGPRRGPQRRPDDEGRPARRRSALFSFGLTSAPPAKHRAAGNRGSSP